MSKVDIKILVACHKEDVFIPELDSLYPVQVGAALAPRHFESMAHDDEGVNISEKNPMYCELTAIYWAWKNLKADYIGLFHYRRYMSFSGMHFDTNYFGDILFDELDEETVSLLNLNDKAIQDAVEGYDIIVTEPSSFVGNPTMKEQFEDSWQNNPEDLKILREIVKGQSPEMLAAFDGYMEQRSGYFCNMFIMKREMFDEYCSWMFKVLEEHERLADYSSYNAAQYRVSGYLAERLTGIFITHMQQKGAKVKELQKAFFEHTEVARELKPAFKKNKAVTAVFAADNTYVPYLSALLQSIKDNANDKKNYDLIVLTRDITSENQATLKNQIEQKNISLRFYDVTPEMRKWESSLNLHGHFQIETYYRLLMQDIMADWDKILYLDSDMIVCKDIAELFETDIDGYLLAAVRDADTAGLYNGYNPSHKEYMDNILQIKNPFDYFQAGTILFNLKEFRNVFNVEDIFNFAVSEDWKLLDQDVLNFIAQGCVKFVPMEWNVMTDWRGLRIKDIISRAPFWVYAEYMNSRRHPAIIHYAGPEKPWKDPESDMADAFWEVSRETPYYEVALARMTGKGKSKGISNATWERLYPLYARLFPDRSRRREVMSYVYRKFVAGKRQ